jgi:hypothetical protein
MWHEEHFAVKRSSYFLFHPIKGTIVDIFCRDGRSRDKDQECVQPVMRSLIGGWREKDPSHKPDRGFLGVTRDHFRHFHPSCLAGDIREKGARESFLSKATRKRVNLSGGQKQGTFFLKRTIGRVKIG